MAEEGPGTLKVLFVYKTDVDKLSEESEELAAICALPSETPAGVTPAGVTPADIIAAEIIVGLAGKAVESVIDAVAARTQPQATTLEATVPLDGFYDENGNMAVADGCLIFYNASKSESIRENSSIFGAFRLIPSFDKSAFRLDVLDWQFRRFLEPSPGHWFQSSRKRDFVLKIEWLTPSSADLGTQAVFIEQSFQAVTVEDIANAFITNQSLPWFASPPRPSDLPIPTHPDKRAGRYMPLNLRVTIVETTKPNQLAEWIQEIAKEKKSDISKAVQDAVRDALDSGKPSAADIAKSASHAATAFAAYKDSWDEAAELWNAQSPAAGADPNAPTRQEDTDQPIAWRKDFAGKRLVVSANQKVARQAFSVANLSWPGDLPDIPPD